METRPQHLVVGAAFLLACRAAPASAPPPVAPQREPAVAQADPVAVMAPLQDVPPPIELVAPPRWVALVAWDFVPDLAEAAPAIDAPPIPTPIRPHAGGDALRLADLALSRGDARDAAAQYRLILEDPHPAVKPYVELQLARAYLAQSDRARAEPLLRSAMTSESPSTWPAVLELATVLIEHHDAVDVLSALEPYAGDRVRLLEDHLMALASEDHMPRLLEVILARDEDPTRACVIERRLRSMAPNSFVPSWRLCPVVARGKPARTGILNKQTVGFSIVYGTWASHLQRPPREPWPWVELAARAADATAVAPDSPLSEITSWMVLATAFNATLAGTDHGIVVTATKQELDRIRGGVIVAHRGYLDLIVASWLTSAD